MLLFPGTKEGLWIPDSLQLLSCGWLVISIRPVLFFYPYGHAVRYL